MPARAVLIAAGTQPNTVLAREDGSILLDGKYFAAVDEDGNPVKPQFSISKPERPDVLMQYSPRRPREQLSATCIPRSSATSWKAMGSAKQGYPGGQPRGQAPDDRRRTASALIARRR